jgi:rhodanese-related sulfurtransferase
LEYAALAIAVLALLVALAAKSSASKLRQAIEDGKGDARRRVENAREETREEVETLRRIVGRLAGGEKLSPEMVLEGRLWREASPEEGKSMVAAGVRYLDVRTPQETARGILPGAILIRCRSSRSAGRRSRRTGGGRLSTAPAASARPPPASSFASGYENLYNLVGGFLSWSGRRRIPERARTLGRPAR